MEWDLGNLFNRIYKHEEVTKSIFYASMWIYRNGLVVNYKPVLAVLFFRLCIL